MTIDNFDIIRKHLDFIDTKLDRYVVHILRRPKDISPEMKNALGANESQRLIKTYYIDSLEYFDKKREAIKELCRANNARAYIIVQPKDNFECLLNLGKKIFDTIQNKNYSVKPEHLIRQAYCEWHKSRKKVWILDLDDEEIQIIRSKKFAVKPMDPEEACIQMELLGHSFFVFRNSETDDVNVVYKRKGNTYGLIEPEF